MRRGLLPWLCLGALSFAAPAWADGDSDCRQFDDAERSIRSCTEIISSGRESPDDLALAYAYRGIAHGKTGDYDGEIGDETRATELNPKLAIAYHSRGFAFYYKGDYDRTIADDSESIRLDPEFAPAFAQRGAAFEAKAQYDREIADETRAIELDPKLAVAYSHRAIASFFKGDYDHVIADGSKAIEADPRLATAYGFRGMAYELRADYDRAIADETKAIELDPKNAGAYYSRGLTYSHKGDYDRAIADQTESIQLKPQFAPAFAERGVSFALKGDYDRATADETNAIELDPKNASAYYSRGAAYSHKGDYDRAIADQSESIRLNPHHAPAFAERGIAYAMKGDYDRAIADETQAIGLNPRLAQAFFDRGYAYGRKGDFDLDIADQTKAIELKGDFGSAYYGRADAYIAKGDRTRALIDFRAAAQLLPTSDVLRGKALARVSELESQIATAAAAPAGVATQAAAAYPGRRVALVIGNSDYAAVAKLPNPEHDAAAIASALTADGFDVATVDNLTRADFISAINRFSDSAAKADWAVIYFAGHGLQLDGVNYLVPVDAKLAADRDVQDEAIALDRIIGAVSGARKLGLIIVDACRNNPFLTNMRFTVAGRAAHTRGLARIEPPGTTLIEFSARDGQEAMDGDSTGNSPFAAALAKRLATPGLEVGKLLREVREDVLAATSNQQEPMFSGDLPAEDVFFRAAR